MGSSAAWQHDSREADIMTSSPSNPVSAPERDYPGGRVLLSLRVLRIAFVALFLSVVVYAVVGTFLADDFPRVTEELQQSYKLISFLGGLCVAALLLIRNFVNRVFTPPDSDSAAEAQLAYAKRISRGRALILLAFVISELIGLLGLLFVLMGGYRRTLYIFCAISLACLILFFPRENN